MTGKFLSAGLVGGLLLGLAWAGASPAGDCPGCGGGFCRTGNPQSVACYAVPSDTGHYIMYKVGGGRPCFGDCPCPLEGTWGWDYRFPLIPRTSIALRWTHGAYQGGIGSYRTEGKKCHDSKSSP